MIQETMRSAVQDLRPALQEGAETNAAGPPLIGFVHAALLPKQGVRAAPVS